MNNRDSIAMIIIFILSSVLIRFGISSCSNLDFCNRPVLNGQCSEPTKSCQYNNFQDVRYELCCPNTTDRCFCCRYVNSNSIMTTCVFYLALGLTGFFFTLPFILWLGFTSIYKRSNNYSTTKND